MLQAGTLIDQRYRLAARLGEGTFGEVWRAEDARLSNRAVAVKFLKAEFLGHAEAVSRFESEADALAQVQHSNVVGVLDRGVWSGHRYLVTEFVAGSTLTAWLDEHRQRRIFPALATVATLLDQLCAGVEAAHAVRVPGPIIHRDLKPDNVLLREQVTGETIVKIVDFGIAQLGGRTGTRTGAMMGTPVYMAPEQALGNIAAVGPATDVFALAVIAVELLTLRAMPDEGEPWWGMAMQRAGEIRGLLGSLRDDVPAAVWEVVVAALHPRAADRTPSAGALRRALQATLSATPSLPTVRTAAPAPSYHPTMPLTAAAVPVPTVWSAPPVASSTTAPLSRAQATARSELPRGAWIAAGGAAVVVALGVASALRTTGGRASATAAPPLAVVPTTPIAFAEPIAEEPHSPAPPPLTVVVPAAAELMPVQQSFAAAPELRGFLQQWLRSLHTASPSDDFGLLYADRVSWNSGLRTPEQIQVQVLEKAAGGGSVSVDFSRSTWRMEDPASPDAARTCRDMIGATGDTRVIRAWAVEMDPRRSGAAMCQRLEGVYLLRVRQGGDGLRICHETWSLREGICASCPTAFVCRGRGR